MTLAIDQTAARSRQLSDAEFWRQQLDRGVRPLGLRARQPRTADRAVEHAQVPLDIRGECFDQLTALTKGEAFLQYAAVAAAVTVCLNRYAEFSPVTIGCPSLKDETDPALQGTVIAIANDVDLQMTFRQLLLNVRRTLLDSHRHQRYPLDQVLADLGKTAASGPCPLFAVALAFRDLHHDMPDVGQDITIRVERDPAAPALVGQISFNAALHDRATIERFSDHVAQLLHSGLTHLDTALGSLDMISDAERTLLMTTWNQTTIPYRADRCVHECFEEWVERQPTRDALRYGDQRLSYRELDERANQLAHRLQAMGVTADAPVGICLNRCPDLVIAVLAVLKSGGAYVPYDPSYPKSRLAMMFEDIRLKVLLTKESLLDRLPAHAAPVVCVDRDAEETAGYPVTQPPKRSGPSNLCYIIFTSGSTGRPKAAAVAHQGWMNLLSWFVRDFEISAADKTLVMSSFSFDITQRAMAMPLTSGGTLHLIATDDYDPALIVRTIEDEQITLMNCAPSTFYPLLEIEQLRAVDRIGSLRVLFLGGEAIAASRLLPWATSATCRTEVANVYGAAECSDVSSAYRLRRYDQYAATSVPIGTPIDNSRVYVVDPELRPVPVGVIGEICLAGDGVGRGYINDRKLTAQKFVDDPFAAEPGKRLYRTGDLGRYRADGTLEFAGRLDHQVKIRGQRVELGEIETKLRQHAAVKDAVVVLRQDSGQDRRLVAYFVPESTSSASGQALIDEVRTALTTALPAYMVPAAFVALTEMPLNPNGKVDRDALPAPPRADSEAVDPDDLPTTATERTVAALYAEILGLEAFSIHDDFFTLGGHSLLATQTIARIIDTLGVRLTADDFFADSTVAGIARHIDSGLAMAT